MGEMRRAERQHQQEGFVGRGAAAQVLLGVGGLGKGIVARPELFFRRSAGIVVRVIVVVIALGALPVVEPLAALGRDVGTAAMPVEVPLADISGVVAGGLENLGHAQFRVWQIEVVQEHARRGREAPGQQRRAVRRAHRAHRYGVGEARAVGRELVEVRRFDVGVARDAEGRGAPLVGEHEDNVRFGGGQAARGGAGQNGGYGQTRPE